MKVEILRHPTEEDWRRCKFLAMSTIGKRDWSGNVTDEWKHSILKAEHSPIRTLMFTVRMEVPYWVSVHFVRHKYGVEHYVTSQRNDRQDEYDRNEAPQNAMVTHIMDVNAQALMHIAQMRLCHQASVETRAAMAEIRDAVVKVNPEFADFLRPKCVIHGGCNEFRPCGYYDKLGDGMRLKMMVDGVEVPEYAKPGDAGMDLRSAEDVWLHPMEIRNVSTGVRIAIPDGYVGDVRPRSGLASKHGITVINSPGTIDSGYRGVVGVPLVNLGKKPFAIAKGDRIAQLVVLPIARCEVELVDELDETERGEGGFGSSGR